MSSNFFDFETKLSSCVFVVFGSFKFQLENIYFDHLPKDNQVYEEIVAKTICAIGKDNVWLKDSLDNLYLQIERLEQFTEIILVGHSYDDSIILGDDLLFSFYDEQLKLACTSKNCRVFVFSCFQQTAKQLPSYIGQMNYLSDFIYRINMNSTLTSSEIENFDKLRLGAEFDDCSRVMSRSSNIHEYVSGHTIARLISGKKLFIYKIYYSYI